MGVPFLLSPFGGFRYEVLDVREVIQGEDFKQGFRTFTMTAGIALVFRLTLCYQRWWEARTQIETMSDRWFQAFTMAIALDDFSPMSEECEQEYRMRIVGLFSLLHAQAMFELSVGKDHVPNLTDLLMDTDGAGQPWHDRFWARSKNDLHLYTVLAWKFGIFVQSIMIWKSQYQIPNKSIRRFSNTKYQINESGSKIEISKPKLKIEIPFFLSVNSKIPQKNLAFGANW